jgi:hypothetical protein
MLESTLPAMPETVCLPAAPSSAAYTIRRLRADDAVGVVRCVRQIYGESYVHPELYDADAIVRLNGDGKLVSVVALAGSEVVGHYALERPDLGEIAETGEALVLPEHRHHQLMERMRDLLETEARRLQLRGLYGNVVTNHVYSQRVVERFGEFPCAFSLGWSPRSFHNMEQSLSQRMSEIVYFKHLQQPTRASIFIPARHAAWCGRIYAQFQLEVEGLSGTPAAGGGEISVEHRPDLARAVLRVHSVGADSVEAIRSHQRRLLAAGTEAIFLELPLAQAGTPALCEAAERLGFYFSGIGPRFARDGDALRMQQVTVALDVAQIQVENPLARELLAYVAAERARTLAVA